MVNNAIERSDELAEVAIIDDIPNSERNQHMVNNTTERPNELVELEPVGNECQIELSNEWVAVEVIADNDEQMFDTETDLAKHNSAEVLFYDKITTINFCFLVSLYSMK